MTYRARCEGRRALKRYLSSHRAMLLGLVREMTSGKEFPELSSVDMSEWTLIEPARVAPAPAKSDQEEWDQ